MDPGPVPDRSDVPSERTDPMEALSPNAVAVAVAAEEGGAGAAERRENCEVASEGVVEGGVCTRCTVDPLGAAGSSATKCTLTG